LQRDIADNSTIRRKWKYNDLFENAPGTSQWATDNARGTGDEMHVVVYDTTGAITGYDSDVAGQRTSSVLEVFPNMSKSSVARTAEGSSNYYADVIFQKVYFHLLDRSYFCWFKLGYRYNYCLYFSCTNTN